MIFDVIGDLFTHGSQLKQLDFNCRIIGLLSKFPILGRIVPLMVRPIHAAQSYELGRDSERTVKADRVGGHGDGAAGRLGAEIAIPMIRRAGALHGPLTAGRGLRSV